MFCSVPVTNQNHRMPQGTASDISLQYFSKHFIAWVESLKLIVEKSNCVYRNCKQPKLNQYKMEFQEN